METNVHILTTNSLELKKAYQLILETSQWLQEKGIEQWETPISFEAYQAAASRDEVYGFYQENQLVGSVTLTRQKDPYWILESGPSLYLHRLIVSRQHKGKNIGEFILKWSLTFAHREGFSYLRLDCRESNPVLKEFYKKQGFSDLGNARGQFVYRLFEQETSDQSGRISRK